MNIRKRRLKKIYRWPLICMAVPIAAGIAGWDICPTGRWRMGRMNGLWITSGLILNASAFTAGCGNRIFAMITENAGGRILPCRSKQCRNGMNWQASGELSEIRNMYHFKRGGCKGCSAYVFRAGRDDGPFVGRTGAFRELVQATELLIANEIAPRWQAFLYEEIRKRLSHC